MPFALPVFWRDWFGRSSETAPPPNISHFTQSCFPQGSTVCPPIAPEKGNQSGTMGNGQNTSKTGHRLSWQAGARKETVVWGGGGEDSMGIEDTVLWSKERLNPQRAVSKGCTYQPRGQGCPGLPFTLQAGAHARRGQSLWTYLPP